MTNLIGQTLLNQYRVENFIASGGMGAVYRVWDIKRNVPLAMKVLSSDLIDDPRAFKSFQREANALRKLTHPNIVPFYGLYSNEDFAFILQQFIDGPSLRDVMRKYPTGMPVDEVIIYLKALCAALGYAHAHGIVHCDIKPGNVMLERNGQIYLTDFGIARHADNATNTTAGAGTPAYMAPEQILLQPVFPATDVYALGVLSFEMLSGQRPFTGAEPALDKTGTTSGERHRYAHLHLQPPDLSVINSRIPQTLASVIRKALAKNYEERYESAPAFFGAICAATGSDASLVPTYVQLNASATSQENLSRPLTTKEYRPISKDLSSPHHLLMQFLLNSVRWTSYGGQALSRWGKSGLEKIKLKSRLSQVEEDMRLPDKAKFSGLDIEMIIPIAQAYDAIKESIFLGREKEINQFVQQVYFSQGGAFCVAGFRGVGKTKFLEFALDRLRENIKTNDDKKLLVDIWLSLPQSYQPKELMHIILSSLISRLKETGVIHKLDKQVAHKLKFIEKRITRTIKISTVNSGEVGTVPSTAFSSLKMTFGKNIEEEYGSYEAPIAERDLIDVLKKLNKTEIRHGLKKISLKMVFVFDELDKIADFRAVAQMMKSLKTLFTESSTTFIFVLGADQFHKLIINDESGSISKVDMYIPCLWNATDNMLEAIVENHHTESRHPNHHINYRNFLKYLSFTGRGVPRRMWKTFDKFMFCDINLPFLGFTAKDIRKFNFYSDFHSWLDQKIQTYLIQKPDFSHIDIDFFKMSIYSVADAILRTQGEWFTPDDITNTIKSINENRLYYTQKKSIEIFLGDMVDNEYLEKIENNYRLHYRRYVIMEAVDDALMTGDFKLNCSPSNNLGSNYLDDGTETEIMVEPVIEHDILQISLEWALLISASENRLTIRANEQHGANSLEIKSKNLFDKCDIGRAINNDIVINQNDVSRYHARLIFTTVGWQIVDMNTANGTLVDNIPISDITTLSSPSIITIGSAHIRFEIQD